MNKNFISRFAELTATDIMTAPVVMLHSHDTMQTAASIFLEKNISGAPVLNEKSEGIGVLTKTDITRYERDRIAHWSALTARESIRTLGTLELIAQNVGAVEQIDSVSQWMTPKVISVAESASFQEVVRNMIHKRVHRLFVVKGKSHRTQHSSHLLKPIGKVIGVITTFDLIKFLEERGDAPHQNKKGE